MKPTITVRAPAKLILSGEHAVVYGQPALAMAVDRVVETVLSWQEKNSVMDFYLPDLGYTASVTLQKLRNLKQRILNKYNKFLKGECTIREVLQRSCELLQYTFIHIIDKLNITLPRGLEIHTRSNIPISCGMGSSAATIISVMHAVTTFLELEIKLDNYLQLGRDTENLQHGYSSGLDLYLSIYGGCARFEDGQTIVRNMPQAPMFVVNTGQPITTTGQCVAAAKRCFQTSNSLATDFAALTEALDQALQANNLANIKECIRANQQLLTHIGVVPEKVQQFVAAAEDLGAAVKVCGSGAIKGQNAGVVLVVTETDIRSLIADYGYTMFPVQGSSCGLQVV